MNLTFYKTVKEAEFTALLKKPQFSCLFKKILPHIIQTGVLSENWLIPSIDISYKTGKSRISERPETHHFNSNAVDLFPLTVKKKISVPIPFNRNLYLMRLFKVAFELEYDLSLGPLVIAFEAEHIHCDVFHKSGVAYYNVTRPYFDKKNHDLAQDANKHAVVNKAINSRELIYI